MKVINTKCPSCPCNYLKITFQGEYLIFVECMSCGDEFRFNKEDVEDLIIEHE